MKAVGPRTIIISLTTVKNIGGGRRWMFWGSALKWIVCFTLVNGAAADDAAVK